MSESSLTAPEDRKFNETKDINDKWIPNVKAEKLTKTETENAFKELSTNLFFPKIERGFCDPIMHNQKIGLFSFIPAKGATPNEKGVFGYAKIRGVFNSEYESTQKAKELIKKFDSMHKIYHVNVGYPFPVTTISDFSKKIDEIDINSELQEEEEKQNQKDEEEMKNIKERQKKLQESSKVKPDPLELYIIEKVKLANLKWTFFRYQKEMEDTKNNILKAKNIIKTMEDENPKFKEEYLEKFKNARDEVGLTNEASDDNFIKYMDDEKYPID